MADDILASIAVVLGLNDAPLKRGLGASVASSAQAGSSAGDSFTRRFADKIKTGFSGGSASSMMAGLTGASAGIFAGLALGVKRGLQSSGEIERYRAAIRAIEPDANKAERAVHDLLDLGIRTGTGADVLEFGTRLADRSGNVGGAVSSATKQIDALAALRTSPAEFKELQTNLSQIFNRGDSKVEADDFQQLRDRAPLLFTEAAKALKTNASEAEKQIRSMSGNEFQKLFEQIGESNKGLAEKNAGSTLGGALNRVNKVVDTGLAPTGKLIEQALTPVVGVLGASATAAAKFNQQAAGVPGLLLGISAAVGALKLGRACLGAISSGVSSSMLSGGPITVTGGPIYVNGGVVGTPGAVGAAGAASGPAASAPSGVKSFLTRFGPGILTAIAPLIGTYAGSKLMDNKSKTWQGQLARDYGAALSGAGIGAGIGGFLGPMGGAVGAGLGAVGGLALNSPTSPLLHLFGPIGQAVMAANLIRTVAEPLLKKNKGEGKGSAGKAVDQANQKPKEQAASDDLKKAATKLSDAAKALSNVVGGSERTQRTTQLLQLEYAGMGLVNAQLGRSGITGVG